MRARGTGSISSYFASNGDQLWRITAKIDGRERSRAGFDSKAAATKAAPELIDQWRAEITELRENEAKAPTWAEALAQTIEERGPRGAWRLRTVESSPGWGSI